MDTSIFLFWVYLLMVLVFFAAMSHVILRIREFQWYSRYLTIVTRIYLVAVVTLAVCGGYQMLSDPIPAMRNRIPIEKLDF